MSGIYIGDFAEDATVNILFPTTDSAGANVAPSSAFEAADIRIYKDNSATQKTATDGITITSPFDSLAGLHQVNIDTSNDTNDAGFWVTGSDYFVVLAPDETVDSQTITGLPLAHFSIENRYMRGTDSANTTTPLDAAGIRSAVGLASANLDTQLGAIVEDTGTTLPGTLATIAGYVDTEIQTIIADIATAQADLNTITGTDGVTLATSQSLYAPAKAGDQMDLVDTPNTTAVTAIQSGLATPTNITAGTITTVTNLTNLPTIPTNWITADGLAADAVTEIQTSIGLLFSGGTQIDGFSRDDAIRFIAAVVAGLIDDSQTATETFKGLDKTTTRVTVTADSSGNRSEITYSGAD